MGTQRGYPVKDMDITGQFLEKNYTILLYSLNTLFLKILFILRTTPVFRQHMDNTG